MIYRGTVVCSTCRVCLCRSKFDIKANVKEEGRQTTPTQVVL